MRRTAVIVTLTALVALGGAAGPSAASLPGKYQVLASKRLRPTPLVPTTAPKVLRPISKTLGNISADRNAYGMRLADVVDSNFQPRQAISFGRGSFRSLAAAVKEARMYRYRIRSVRIRGTRGRLFTSSKIRELAWKEKGAVYRAFTRTPKTVSLKGLQLFVKGLEPLGPEWAAGICSEGICQTLNVVTTPSTVSLSFDWQAGCEGGAPGGSGDQDFSLLPRKGNSFSFGLSPAAGQPWTVTGSGTVRPDGVTVNARATGAPRGVACDTGPLAFDANERFEE